MRDIIELPHDLFLILVLHLSPRTCVRCRAVSRQWHAAFTHDLVSLLLLRWNFPRCRELRLTAASAAASVGSASSARLPRNLKAELVDAAEQPRNWSATFTEVTRRYFNLGRAQARAVEKLELAVSNRTNDGFSFWGVAPWNRFLRFEERTSNFHYPDPVWSYSQDDGILVYPAATDAEDGPSPDHCDGHVYHIIDLSTSQRVPVPFDVRSKHIRRVRLAQGVLIIEWAEALPYHQLNDREVVHRHFVTAFDVVRKPSASTSGKTWTVEFRSEWKLHFLGLPLNNSDRFFSAHTATHYAVYFWQPNRSLYQDDPIEQLAVWDISTPSPYRPSEDPRGHKRPAVTRAPSLPTGLWSGQNSTAAGRVYGLADSHADFQRPRRASLSTAAAGPQVIRRMAWRELDFYGLRQRATPRLRCLDLDDGNLYMIEEEHRWADGQHSSLSPPRFHMVRSTGIPVVPTPTQSPPQAIYPVAARSATNLSPSVDQIDRKPIALSAIVEGPVNGPMWVDTCGANGDFAIDICWRVIDGDGTPFATNPTEGVELALPRGSGLEDVSNQQRPQLWRNPMGWPWTLGGMKSPRLAGSASTARWPGWAPCWRHENFPYLTVAEMVDFAAGVRITARHCFMLENLSVHVRPALAVKTPPEATVDRDDGDGVSARRRASNAKYVSMRSKEICFHDTMWSELVAKGHIAGDERWIVGEDERGRVTIVRF